MSHVLTASQLPAQTAGGSDAYAVLGAVGSVGGTNNYAKKASVMAPTGYTTVTGAATNNATISIGYRRAGASRVVIASVTLASGTNITAGTTLDVPVSLTQATRSQLQPGDVIDVLLHQNGTGLALGAGLTAQLEID